MSLCKGAGLEERGQGEPGFLTCGLDSSTQPPLCGLGTPGDDQEEKAMRLARHLIFHTLRVRVD